MPRRPDLASDLAPDLAPARAGHVETTRRRRPFLSLTWRILALNVLALGILVAGLLYLDQYRDGLVEAKTAALKMQAEIIAGALGESAAAGEPGTIALDLERSRQLVPRLVRPTGTRARLFDLRGRLVADSRQLSAAGREVETLALPPPDDGRRLGRLVAATYDWVTARLPQPPDLPTYQERETQTAADYPEVLAALSGETGAAQRIAADGTIIISVALPVQKFKKVLATLMLSSDTVGLEDSVRTVRLAILQVFGVTLAVTVLMSLFLAGTIARPVRRLAAAADRVRRGHGERASIPDFTARRDEIGDLSGALRDMTDALYRRLDEIEAFAADVAHEIRNPLSSLSSAVESLERTRDSAKRAQLSEIVQDDVKRLDRLITDISDASRLDAELSRAAFAPVDIGRLVQSLAEVHRATAGAGAPAVEVEVPHDRDLTIRGIEDRLAQVLRNLLGNAASFSPPGGTVRFRVGARGGGVDIVVEDEGPGIPEESLDKVFGRFYSARPASEAFGAHSGLGLSISRQIVEAHGGALRAENRRDGQGRVIGARLLMWLAA